MTIFIGVGELVWYVILKLNEKIALVPVIRPYIRRIANFFGAILLKDDRNSPYLPWIMMVGLWTPLLFIWAATKMYTEGFSWKLFFTYHFLRVGPRMRLFAHVHVLVHKEGHERSALFKDQFWFLNGLTTWFIGSLYGIVPMTYHTFHNKIHHSLTGGVRDMTTSLDLDRSYPSSFFLYLPRFICFWNGISCVGQFLALSEWELAKKMWIGWSSYHTFAALIFFVDPRICLALWLYPQIESAIFLAGVSYVWHAWVDPNCPDNEYVNSLTILNGKDNIFQEDFHVEHHRSRLTHWTEYPLCFEQFKDEYAKEMATIFENTEQGEVLYLTLFGRFDSLAEKFVDLNQKLNHQQKKELLLLRMKTCMTNYKKD